MKKILSIKAVQDVDENPDMSYIGEFTDSLEDGVIIRRYDKYYEDLTEDEKEETEFGRGEYRGFKPSAGDEKVGTENYRKYGMQDYDRIRKYIRNEWCFLTICVKAYLEINGVNQLITSGYVGGIESDSEESEIKQVVTDQLDELKKILKEINFTQEEIDEAVKNAKLE